jgi:glyoxylase-like metal-dependent hydrolase (beta-lactamase superfamily II)
MAQRPVVHSFFDQHTFTISHLVADPTTKHAVIIDSVLDFDPASGRLSPESAERMREVVEHEGYTIDWILETHAHADHVTAAQYLKQALGGKIAIGERIKEVQAIFAKVFNLSKEFPTDGSQFDHLWKDGETFMIGSLQGRVMATPGHTPADVSYLIGDALFVGDTIFMPDYGTARCDFPGGDAGALFESIQTLYTLPEQTRVFLCHDYLSPSRQEYQWQTTIIDQKMTNIHVAEHQDKVAFIQMREERDRALGMPRLIIPSIQINIRAGALPDPEENGIVYLKTPVNGAFAAH